MVVAFFIYRDPFLVNNSRAKDRSIYITVLSLVLSAYNWNCPLNMKVKIFLLKVHLTPNTISAKNENLKLFQKHLNFFSQHLNFFEQQYNLK